MSVVLSKYVWLERLMVLLATVGVNIGVVTTTQETDIAAGGVTGAIVFVQLVMTLVTHWRTLEARLRNDMANVLTSIMTPPVMPVAVTPTTFPTPLTGLTTTLTPGQAAEAAGKAPTA